MKGFYKIYLIIVLLVFVNVMKKIIHDYSLKIFYQFFCKRTERNLSYINIFNNYYKIVDFITHYSIITNTFLTKSVLNSKIILLLSYRISSFKKSKNFKF